jgi:hypothetical protein
MRWRRGQVAGIGNAALLTRGTLAEQLDGEPGRGVPRARRGPVKYVSRLVLVQHQDARNGAQATVRPVVANRFAGGVR